MTKKTDARTTLLAALATYVKETYGVPIEKYRDAWLNEPDTKTPRYPFEALDLVATYDDITKGTI